MKFFGTRVGLSAAGYSLMRAHFEIFTIYIFYYIFQLPIGCYKQKKNEERNLRSRTIYEEVKNVTTWFINSIISIRNENFYFHI